MNVDNEHAQVSTQKKNSIVLFVNTPNTQTQDMPPWIGESYDRNGNTYESISGWGTFVDMGSVLETDSDEEELVKDLVAIAKLRAGNSLLNLKLHGSKVFKQWVRKESLKYWQIEFIDSERNQFV